MNEKQNNLNYGTMVTGFSNMTTHTQHTGKAQVSYPLLAVFSYLQPHLFPEMKFGSNCGGRSEVWVRGIANVHVKVMTKPCVNQVLIMIMRNYLEFLLMKIIACICYMHIAVQH